MPVIYSPVSEQTDHIFDVVSKQLVHKVLVDLDPLAEISNYINLDNGYSAPQNTSDENHNIILANDKLQVSIANNTNPKNLKWDTLTTQHMTGQLVSKRQMHHQFKPIFADKLADIVVYEMTLPTSLSLEFNLQIYSRDLAYQIPSQLFRRYAPGLVFTEVVTYDYPVPLDIVNLLYGCYKMRRFSTPDVTFKKYIDFCSNSLFQANMNRADTNNEIELVIPKLMMNVTCTIDYSEDKPGEIKIARSAGGYEIKFSLQGQFERVDMLNVNYPCIIDNNLLPETMLPKPRSTMPMPSLSGPYPIKTIDEAISSLSMYRTTAVRMPAYDDWSIPPSIVRDRSYREFLIASFLIDEESTTAFTDIDLSADLTGDGDSLHPIVKEILIAQGIESFRTDCIFNISVYLGDKIIEPKTLKFDSSLKLQVPCKDIHSTHRLMISEITDIRYLDPKWLPYIRRHWPFFIITDQMSSHLKNGLLTTKDDTFVDPKKNILGGTDDSYWPLRIINADIIPRRSKDRNESSTTR